ncbi:MAG: 23S rRNA (pseudouridine(1915)-N(3))-methyltransferase RlmH [Flavobacteriales bacterium]
MKIKLIAIGKTDEKYLQDGIVKYLNRLKHYISFEIIIITDVKVGSKQNTIMQKDQEGKLLLNSIGANDYVILLDENGKQFNSVDFSEFIQKRMNASLDVVFVIGGAYGFSDSVYSRANDKLSLSKMTFSHQMIRLFFVEQLYRGFTILKGEKYHHQ